MSDHPNDIHAATISVLAAARARASRPIVCVCTEWTDSWFDRSICPEPCGSMHNICVECSYPQGGCLVEAGKGQVKNSLLDLLDLIVSTHAPEVDDDENTWCDECFDENEPSEDWTWPCRFYAASSAVIDALAADAVQHEPAPEWADA